jgi:hypothetical protein
MGVATPEAILERLEETIAAERQWFEAEKAFEQIVASQKSLLCSAKAGVEHQRGELERLKRNRPDLGHYYRFVPAESVDNSFREEAEMAFKIATAELSLTDLGLQIQWFDNKCHQIETRKDFLAGAVDTFSEKAGLRGFISWTGVLDTRNVYLASQWHNSPVARVTAHELYHIWQRIGYGLDKVPAGWNSQIEMDADNFAADFWDRHKHHFRP